MSDDEDLSDDIRETALSLAGLDRPDRRAIRLLVDLFTEQGGSNVNYRWVIRELDQTAAALCKVAHNLRCQQQQAEQERRTRLQVIEGGARD